jgi:hypothetical protein
VSLPCDHLTTSTRQPTPHIVRCCHSRFAAAPVATRRRDAHCVHGPSRRVPPPRKRRPVCARLYTQHRRGVGALAGACAEANLKDLGIAFRVRDKGTEVDFFIRAVSSHTGGSLHAAHGVRLSGCCIRRSGYKRNKSLQQIK